MMNLDQPSVYSQASQHSKELYDHYKPVYHGQGGGLHLQDKMLSQTNIFTQKGGALGAKMKQEPSMHSLQH